MSAGEFTVQPALWLMLLGLTAFCGAVVCWLYLRERKQRLALEVQLDAAARQTAANQSLDNLTGLLSRAGFDTALDQINIQAEAVSGKFCVLYVGLDNFGQLNDAFGRLSGDGLLKSVADRLTHCADPKTKISRITSAEFAMVVPGPMPAGASLAHRVVESMADPYRFDKTQVVLGCSIGIAEFPAHGQRAKILVNAELAMRAVKDNGGGDFCLYDPTMGAQAREEALMVHDLRGALAAGQLALYFQPKVDASDLQVTAAEALLRWHHPARGLVSPVVFIPLAERYGLIGEIGNWVIEEACRKAAGWRDRGLRMRVAVNISSHQMREDDLVERIESALQRNNLQPSRFTCEITESIAMEDTKVTQATFEKMRRAGLHVSIDDFGTGHSSLAILRKLPAVELKIDSAFVTDLEYSEDARLIARTIVNMARTLNLRVVAEGVETIGQCQLLIDLGCNELQGFLFSKPIPAEDLEWLAHNAKREGVEFRPSLFMSTVESKLQ